eukprot:6210003-Pleurochrysis_carterae.AAC.2
MESSLAYSQLNNGGVRGPRPCECGGGGLAATARRPPAGGGGETPRCWGQTGHDMPLGEALERLGLHWASLRGDLADEAAQEQHWCQLTRKPTAMLSSWAGMSVVERRFGAERGQKQHYWRHAVA